MDLSETKRALRRRLIAERDALAGRENLAPALLARAEALLATTTGAVAAYRAMGSELDPAGLLQGLAAQGRTVALPRITSRGEPLVFHAWREGDPLLPGPLGTRQPEPSAPIVVPDVLLVPLLAFDRRCCRLGYGGGFYDRTLQLLRSKGRPVAIGLAFAAQELDHLPVEPFDEVLDAVVTEHEVVTG